VAIPVTIARDCHISCVPGGQAHRTLCRRSIDALKPPTTVVIRRFHQLLGKRKSGKVVGEMAIFNSYHQGYATKSNGYAFLTQSLQPSSHGKSLSFSGQKHCINRNGFNRSGVVLIMGNANRFTAVNR
jgi:hypothetical protein